MGCERCNIKLRPGEECLYCWKIKKEQPTINPMYRYVMNWNEGTTINHTFITGSTTSTWGNWDDEDWYISTADYTR